MLRAIFSALIIAGAAHLVMAQAEADSPTTIEELKALNDLTILQSRAWIDTEWDHFKHGAEEATWTFGGASAWPVRKDQDWGVKFNFAGGL